MLTTQQNKTPSETLPALGSSLAEATRRLREQNNSLERHLLERGWRIASPVTGTDTAKTAKLDQVRK